MSEQLVGLDVAGMYEYALKRGQIPRFAGAFFKTGDVAGLGGAINPTYGALVYDQVNRQANAHAILRKEVWERSGFRYTTSDPATKGYGFADPGSVGTVVDTTPTEVSDYPAFLHTPFDLTMDAGFRARHDDGMDIWQWLVTNKRDVHAQLLNEELLRSAEVSQDVSTGATTDAKSDVTNTASGGRGKGLETIDRIIGSEEERDDVDGNANSGWYDLYAAAWDRDTGTTLNAQVVRPDGVDDTYATQIPFQMKGIDTIIDNTESQGADPSAQVFLTRYDTRRAFYDELGAQGRFDLTDVQAKLDMGGLSVTATHPGRDITFTVRAYQDRPIVVDKFVPNNSSGQTAVTTFPQGATTGGGLGHWYLIDQRHMHIKVGFPTLYVDVDNPVIRGQFDTKALFLTCQQLYVTRPQVMGKVRNISS